MRIVLLRHGEPKSNLSDNFRLKISANEIKSLISVFNDSGLNKQKMPTSEALYVAKSCKAVVCSNLPRSIESAKALGVQTIDLIDPVFREAELPHPEWRYPKLALITWFLVLRALWFLGYSNNNGEPITSANKRAEKAFLKLRQIAEEHSSVMLIGHGIINQLIAKRLIANGWRGPKKPGNKYWEYGIYDFIKI